MESSGDMADRIERLERLADLRSKGILTEEEFNKQKDMILSNRPLDADASKSFSEQNESTHESNEITWDNLINDDYIMVRLEQRVKRYKEIFKSIIVKSETQFYSIEDTVARHKILTTRKWNWGAFWFGVLWASWRGVEKWWLFVAIVAVAPAVGRILIYFNIMHDRFFTSFGVPLIMGMMLSIAGNSYLLVAVADKTIENRKDNLLNKIEPSFVRALLAAFAIGTSSIIFDEGGLIDSFGKDSTYYESGDNSSSPSLAVSSSPSPSFSAADQESPTVTDQPSGYASSSLSAEEDARRAAVQAADSSDAAANQAADFMRAYFVKSGSASGISAQSMVQSSYAERVNFYGKDVDRSYIEREKTKYNERWSERKYSIDEGSLNVNCGYDGNLCSVQGIIYYDASSIERGAHGAGRAEFNYGVELSSGGPRIISEESHVLH